MKISCIEGRQSPAEAMRSKCSDTKLRRNASSRGVSTSPPWRVASRPAAAMAVAMASSAPGVASMAYSPRPADALIASSGPDVTMCPRSITVMSSHISST